MKLTDIDEAAVRKVLDKMSPGKFRTKDLSIHRDMIAAHKDYLCETHYHSVVGRYLSKHDVELGIEHLKDYSSTDDGALWERIGGVKTTSNPPDSMSISVSIPAMPSGLTRSPRPVRDGHYKSLDYMLTPTFEGVKNLFESIPEIGGVYFRPTDKGITVVDLHPKSLKPRIGVGSNSYIVRGTSAANLAPSMKERVEYLQGIRDKQRGPSLENQFEARMIREAQDNHLIMPGCPDELRFIHSQWRMDPDTDGNQRLTDLLAVDIVKRQLVILELKIKRDNSAFQQVQGYLEYFDNHWDDLMPFFTRVAQVMGRLYDCPELANLDCLNQGVIPFVAWPGANGFPIVTGGDE